MSVSPTTSRLSTPAPSRLVNPGNALNTFANLGNVMKGISDVSPIIITGFMFMNTAFNYDLKAFIWIGPLFLWLALMRLLQSTLIKDNLITNPECSHIWGRYKSPSLSSFFIMYTFAYIATPMPINDDWNYAAILMFLILFGLDAVVRLNYQCTTRIGIAIGGVSGLIIGVLTYFILSWAGLGKFLYYTTGDTNNVYCSKPKEQQFKCHVYKNGNIISTI